MTEKLYRQDPYLKETTGEVLSHVDLDGIVLDRTVFYSEGGGQPGDTGELEWDAGKTNVSNTEDRTDGAVVLRIADPNDRPPVGAKVTQRIDWERRYRHMRMHTALHLLTVVLPFPVTGGQITGEKSRLDFKMPSPAEGKAGIEAQLNKLAERNLSVGEEWISGEELAENPGLVKTRSVQPPTENGKVRLVRIGDPGETVDLQPCGGTHVSDTGEIGPVIVGKIENKGKDNRRVSIRLA